MFGYVVCDRIAVRLIHVFGPEAPAVSAADTGIPVASVVSDEGFTTGTGDAHP